VNWLDILLLLVILASVVTSFLRGFARVAVGLLASIAAVIGALWLYGTAGSWLTEYVSSKAVANFCGFLLVFVGILLLGVITGKLLAMIFKWTGLSWLDRLLGAGVGLVRGLLIATAMVMAIMAFSPKPPPQSVAESRIAPYVMGASRVMISMAPREAKDTFQASYDMVKRMWAGAVKKGS
jgi:membrane protein required for colicin V production